MKCVCSTARHAARVLTRYYEQELRPANVTPAQFELLSTLHFRPGISQSNLAEAVGAEQTTLSRNIKLLMSRKQVVSATSKEDHRQSAYRLSKEGEAVWLSALPHWERAQANMRQLLGSEWNMVMAALNTLRNATPNR